MIRVKKLTNDQRDIMYLKRRSYKGDFDDLAIILNCKKEYIVDAQIGKEVPEDVYEAIANWVNPTT